MPDAPETNDDTPQPDGGTEESAATPDAEREPSGGDAPAAPDAIIDPKIVELSSLLIHLKADFDNYRKRSQKEIASAMRMGELDAVKKFIPAISNLERAIAAASQTDAPAGLIEGIKAIHHQLVGILSALKIERIPGVGTPFDPALHDAVAATASPDVPPGTVVDEFEAGWQADGRALVPAKVRVSTSE